MGSVESMNMQCKNMRPKCCRTAEEEQADSIFLLADGTVIEADSAKGRLFVEDTHEECDTNLADGFCPSPSKAFKSMKNVTPAATKMTLEFLVDGKRKDITFTQRLLGMVIGSGSPPVVGEVMAGSHAEALGVREGWQVTAVEDEDVTHLGATAVKERILRLSQLLPGTSEFAIEFDDEGESKHVVFTEAPMGIRFWTMNPFKVDKVSPASIAFDRGVRPGWKVVKIAGEDVQERSWDSVMQVIADHAQLLPAGAGRALPSSSLC